MSYYYGKRSSKNLDTCHVDLQLILREAIKVIDISIIEGHRTVERQQELFNADPPRTKIDGITVKGKHNFEPSLAADLIPYKKGIDPFENTPKNAARFYFMMGIIKAIAARLLELGCIEHDVRFGLDWNRNDVFTDQNFDDLPHVELVKV